MTGGLIADEKWGFREKGCVDQMFILNQIREKAREQKCGFYRFGEVV